MVLFQRNCSKSEPLAKYTYMQFHDMQKHFSHTQQRRYSSTAHKKDVRERDRKGRGRKSKGK